MNVDRESFLPGLTLLPDTTFTLLDGRLILSFSSGHDDNEINEEIATMKNRNLKRLKDAGRSVGDELQ